MDPLRTTLIRWYLKSRLAKSWTLIVGLVFVAAVASCAYRPKSRELSKAQIANALKEVAPWPDSSTNYSQENWNTLISEAQLIQTIDPKTVAQALREYQQSYALGRVIDNDGKLLLLIRLIFDLPEREPGPTRVLTSFGGWVIRNSDRNLDGTINPAWPVSWTDRNPRLVSGFLGLQGHRYDAAAEYRYLRGK